MVDVQNNIQRYESYKESGVDWLGEIPEHWEVKPGFTILSESKKKNTGFIEDTVLSLSYGNVIVKPKEKLTGLVPESFETYQMVEPGDIIIRPTDLQNDKTSLRTGLAKNDGIITSAYINLRVNKKNNNSFYHYYLHTIDINKVIYGLGSGLRQNISFEDFKRFPFPFPPLTEQIKIAQFLDDKTTKIDEAIAIKVQQINLLKERKQILIHKAVTRGLDDSVTLKDSGVEWIGEIPEHWELSRLKNHMNMITGFPFKSEKYTEEGIKLARGINVKEGVLNWKDTRCWPKVEEHLVDYLLADGDVLIAMDGSKVGKNFCQIKESDLPVLLLQRVARLRPKESLTSNYLYYNIVNRNFLQWVEMTKTDPMVPHIAPADIKNFQIPIPPLSEQKEISAYIETASQKIETAIGLKQQEIEKLKEYKSSLINGVVTGKVRVC